MRHRPRRRRPLPSGSAAGGRTAAATSRLLWPCPGRTQPTLDVISWRPLKTPTAYPPLRTSNAPTRRSVDAWSSRALIGSSLDGSGGNVTVMTALRAVRRFYGHMEGVGGHGYRTMASCSW